MGRASQNLHPRSFLVQLALSDQLLTNGRAMRPGCRLTPPNKLMAQVASATSAAKDYERQFEQTSNVAAGNAKSKNKC